MAKQKLSHPSEPETETTTPETVQVEAESTEGTPVVVEGNVVLAPVADASVVPSYDPEQLAACQNLSQRIRYLHNRGLKISQIVKVLKVNAKGSPLIYQHVRNVLKQSVKTPA